MSDERPGWNQPGRSSSRVRNGRVTHASRPRTYAGAMSVSDTQQAFIYEAEDLAIRWEEDSGYWIWDNETGDDLVWFALERFASSNAAGTRRLGRMRVTIEPLGEASTGH